jgi:transposase
VAAGHLGGGARLINEDQAFWIEIGLGVEPGLTLAQDVGTALLGRMPGLFLSVIP